MILRPVIDILIKLPRNVLERIDSMSTTDLRELLLNNLDEIDDVEDKALKGEISESEALIKIQQLRREYTQTLLDSIMD